MADPNGGEESENVNEEAMRGVKRKLESMLNWVNEIAKDPGHPVVGSIPIRSKWRRASADDDDEPWKQVLLARQALLKANVHFNTKQLTFQKSQKMHPSMYNDNLGSGYNLRVRRKLSTAAKSSTGIGHVDLADELGRKQNGKGPLFQAELPEWTDLAYESDSKWLGFRVWPPENTERRIERDPIGKGRKDSCGCQAPGSTECVKFHITEESGKVKLELGPAFDQWKFTEMGEQVALSWTADEENVFETTAKSHVVDRWDKLPPAFPTKSRENLVSYYFNVFLLRHPNQSPATVNHRGSALRRPGSISSPSKSHSNSR